MDEMTPMSTPAVDIPESGRCRAIFPERFRVRRLQADGARVRYEVSDPVADRLWRLGGNELTIARAFDGSSTYESIAGTLAEQHGIRIRASRLPDYEDKLCRLGLIELPGERPRHDPFTGMPRYGLRRLLVLPLFAVDPDPWLDRIGRRLLAGATACAAIIVVPLALLAVALIGSAYPALRETAALLDGWDLAVLYAVVLASGVLHEGGHALACKVQNVRVREVGFAIYVLMPFAWTRPDRDDWERLPRRGRVAAIVAGPLTSLALAGGCLFGLTGVSPDSGLAVWYLMGTVAGIFGAVVTMLPFLNGDGYLLLSELLGEPNLRQQSFAHLRRGVACMRKASSGSGEPGVAVSPGYLCFALFVIGGWALLGVAAVAGLIRAVGGR